MKRDNWYRHIRRNLQIKWDSIDKEDMTVEERLISFERFVLDELAMTKHLAIEQEFQIHPNNAIV